MANTDRSDDRKAHPTTAGPGPAAGGGADPHAHRADDEQRAEQLHERASGAGSLDEGAGIPPGGARPSGSEQSATSRDQVDRGRFR